MFSLAFSPLMSSRLLASGHVDMLVRLWNPSTSAQVGTLTGHSKRISSLAFNPNGLLASGSADKDIKLWNVATATELKTLSSNDSVVAVAFRSDGLLASGLEDQTIGIWNCGTGF